MKILLIYPPLIDYSYYGKEPVIDAFPQVGLSYIYSYLKQNSYDCKLYDFFYDSWDYIKTVLKEEKADIIGISCLTESRINALKLVHYIRKIKKNTIIIFGGHHSTYMCDQLLNNYKIDYIVLGEGEHKLLKLIMAIEGKIPLDTVNGIAYKKNNQIIKISRNDDFIIDLDVLPFPYSEEQLHIFKKYPPLNEIYPKELESLSHLPFIYKKGRGVIIITSRGCPFNCQFCASSKFWGKKYRFRSPKNVVDEIEFYNKKLGFKFFRFWDYAFTIIPERSINICKKIIDRNLKIFFTCQSRADIISEELVFWLKKAGCIFISIGVESGSKRILKNINKNLSLNSILNAFSICKKLDLMAIPFIMVGNQGETKSTIRKTINLLQIIKPSKIIITKTMVLPGTDLYKLAKKQKFIDDDYWLTAKPQPYYTYENSLATLKKWELEIKYYDKKKYVVNILRFLNNLNSFADRHFKSVNYKIKRKLLLDQRYKTIERL